MANRKAQEKINFADLLAIGEAAEALKLPQHVLRFWETRFRQLNPVKRAGGRRFYRPSDVSLLKTIRHLLYQEGYTIRGVQKILKERGVEAVILQVTEAQQRIEDLDILPQSTGNVAETAQIPEQSSFNLEAPLSTTSERIEPHIEVPAHAPSVELAPLYSSSNQPLQGSWADLSLIPTSVLEGKALTIAETQSLQKALSEIEECKRLLLLARRSHDADCQADLG
ncbi:MAG: MerR family transcriptional regulator [Methylocystis sp.]